MILEITEFIYPTNILNNDVDIWQHHKWRITEEGGLNNYLLKGGCTWRHLLHDTSVRQPFVYANRFCLDAEIYNMQQSCVMLHTILIAEGNIGRQAFFLVGE